jgi:hypothetical protein
VGSGADRPRVLRVYRKDGTHLVTLLGLAAVRAEKIAAHFGGTVKEVTL